jgi:hypothetical protein
MADKPTANASAVRRKYLVTTPIAIGVDDKLTNDTSAVGTSHIYAG